jgi:hypothetical protein
MILHSMRQLLHQHMLPVCLQQSETSLRTHAHAHGLAATCRTYELNWLALKAAGFRSNLPPVPQSTTTMVVLAAVFA